MTTFAFDQIAQNITERVEDPRAAGVDRYVGLEHLDPNSTEIGRWGAPDEVGATKLRFYPDDVIYARRRAYQRKLGIARFDGICSAHALVLRARPEVCLPAFLPYFLLSDQFHQRALEISVGSLSPTINWSTLQSQEFEVPDLRRQSEIVNVVTSIDNHVRHLETLTKKIEATRDLQLVDYLSRLKAESRARSVPLGEVVDIHGGLTPSMGEQRYWEHGETPWISSGDILNLANALPTRRISRAAIEENALRIFPAGSTVVVVRSGILAHTFPVGRLPFDSTVNQDIKVLLPKSDQIDSAFLFSLLKVMSNDVLASCRKSGTTVQSISLDALRRFQITVPNRVEDQIDAASKFELSSDAKKVSVFAREVTAGLRSSILNAELS